MDRKGKQKLKRYFIVYVIFAAGDVRTKMLRQIITAAADGANAVESVQHGI